LLKNLSDEDFLFHWERSGRSPAKMARTLKIDIRNIYRRRRVIEASLAKPIPTRPHASNSALRPLRPERIQRKLKDGSIVIFSDAHFWPGEPTAAHTALIKVIKVVKPKIVVANGDVLDGATTSRFHALGWEERPKLFEEVKAAQDRMAEIERASGKAELIFTLGNHDNRLDGWLANQAPQVENLPGTSLADYFSRWEFAMSLHVNADTKGHTVIKHRFKGGKFAAANNTLNAGTHMVTGHDHMLDVFSWSDYTGRKYGVRTGQLSEPYGPQFHNYTEDNPRAWCSGFAVLTYSGSLLLPPELCYVIDGKAYFRGAKI
jgi:Calcineurin-like phosphoesterase